jgi:hypothetical protein
LKITVWVVDYGKNGIFVTILGFFSNDLSLEIDFGLEVDG